MRRRILLVAGFFLLMCVAKSQFDVKVHILDGMSDSLLKAKIEDNSSRFLSEMGMAFALGEQPVFDSIDILPTAQKTILSIWTETGHFNCSVTEIDRKIMHRADGGYQLRDIPVFMPEAENAGQKQSLVLNFTKGGTICEIYQIPENQDISAVLDGGKEVKEFIRRQRILDFVEKFRTAYNTKDTGFLKMVFSDNALIITGKVVKVATTDNTVSVPKEKIVYTTQTKKQYLDKLAYLFKINKYLNIEFKDYEIQQHPKYPDLYGVVFFQVWNTEYYKDKGYVFLMIDFANENEPMIHIRTWQPEKYNGQQLKKEEVFRVTSFDITR
ncbi:MAG: hypothetical protein LBR36_00050 [Bacteroidales bacterium]|jgi:hypothetical protein|nr:hypothetical protein [Bacteroidales bacterium]